MVTFGRDKLLVPHIVAITGMRRCGKSTLMLKP
ncbi:hypothetical ATPase [Coxiella burnetii CbuK_Q154]|nr:hypothetical ATPase [Coxiella burnetii CbuK_Q154]